MREAYDLTPQDARTAILGTSGQTCIRRIKTPQDLTLREIAQFIKCGYAPEQDVLNVVGMFIAEIAKD